ncbi:hypothetical protein [Paraburkholderia phosphatilytica]|uniref:hypothetical protein n=1 Tax=Paraburkholderia phosphatilytica TaxID=2282883 RepID=UPI000E551F9F|nr:hypothetical protein [Paraburkholderia phosphatilytica]
MKKSTAALAVSVLPVLLAACAQFQNPDAGDPVVEQQTQRPAGDVIACVEQEAAKHHASYTTSAIPQGTMLEFADSNVIKVRSDNGATLYRYYAGKRHANNLWIEGASKVCAP